MHPLSRCCVDICDQLVQVWDAQQSADLSRCSLTRRRCAQDLVREVSASCSATPSETPSGAVMSAPHREILALEAQASERYARQIEDLTKGEAGSDIFGNHAKQIVDTLTCTNCGTQIASNRFAPHLERCILGKGRASARVARDMMRSSADSDTRLAY